MSSFIAVKFQADKRTEAWCQNTLLEYFQPQQAEPIFKHSLLKPLRCASDGITHHIIIMCFFLCFQPVLRIEPQNHLGFGQIWDRLCLRSWTLCKGTQHYLLCDLLCTTVVGIGKSLQHANWLTNWMLHFSKINNWLRSCAKVKVSCSKFNWPWLFNCSKALAPSPRPATDRAQICSFCGLKAFPETSEISQEFWSHDHLRCPDSTERGFVVKTNSEPQSSALGFAR